MELSESARLLQNRGSVRRDSEPSGRLLLGTHTGRFGCLDHEEDSDAPQPDCPGNSAHLPGGKRIAQCAALAVMSPVWHHTRWTGLSQRLLWIALIAWLLRTVWQRVPGLDKDATQRA